MTVIWCIKWTEIESKVIEIDQSNWNDQLKPKWLKLTNWNQSNWNWPIETKVTKMANWIQSDWMIYRTNDLIIIFEPNTIQMQIDCSNV